ncbi:hypothetical protein HW532_18410 [Kaustia mangrovi]|uniref:Uncharacterized protein n=1 Tax=Kaustia mangrovi TaxID=2593653 RepID=A0A7S8C6V4_9HYPH|nr:hypothetical protein [Kaustia mangrovi]QPC44495.1 hypothetical protein HW532_18410 [Kaustia mangrovi]
MSAFDRLPVERRIQEIEEALARAFCSGSFEIVNEDGQRYLRPIVPGAHGPDIVPLLDLYQAAREIERYLP